VEKERKRESNEEKIRSSRKRKRENGKGFNGTRFVDNIYPAQVNLLSQNTNTRI